MSKKSTGALLVGLVAGAVTGVLFAPSKGKEFRKKVREEIEEGGYGNESVWKHFKGMATDIKNTSKKAYEDSELDEFVDKTVSKAKGKAKQLKSQAKNTAKSVKSTAKKKVSTAKSKAKSKAAEKLSK